MPRAPDPRRVPVGVVQPGVEVGVGGERTELTGSRPGSARSSSSGGRARAGARARGRTTAGCSTIVPLSNSDVCGSVVGAVADDELVRVLHRTAVDVVDDPAECGGAGDGERRGIVVDGEARRRARRVILSAARHRRAADRADHCDRGGDPGGISQDPPLHHRGVCHPRCMGRGSAVCGAQVRAPTGPSPCRIATSTPIRMLRTSPPPRRSRGTPGSEWSRE